MAVKIRAAVPWIAVLLGSAAILQAQMALPIDGAKLFGDYCAACHGARGTANGPMTPALKTRVPDLTLIAQRNGGTFPTDLVQAMIAGEKPTGLSHGTREMPVWGPIFSSDISDRDYGKLRVYNVTKYLESLQKK
jgi:mono/diheme cytochrome c family protein